MTKQPKEQQTRSQAFFPHGQIAPIGQANDRYIINYKRTKFIEKHLPHISSCSKNGTLDSLLGHCISMRHPVHLLRNAFSKNHFTPSAMFHYVHCI